MSSFIYLCYQELYVTFNLYARHLSMFFPLVLFFLLFLHQFVCPTKHQAQEDLLSKVYYILPATTI